MWFYYTPWAVQMQIALISPKYVLIHNSFQLKRINDSFIHSFIHTKVLISLTLMSQNDNVVWAYLWVEAQDGHIEVYTRNMCNRWNKCFYWLHEVNALNAHYTFTIFDIRTGHVLSFLGNYNARRQKYRNSCWNFHHGR